MVISVCGISRRRHPNRVEPHVGIESLTIRKGEWIERGSQFENGGANNVN